MKIRISVVAVMLVAGTAGTLPAQTFEWTDAGGVVHFTDNPETVPRKYRGSVRVRESVRSTVEEQAPSQRAVPVSTPVLRGETMYDGKPYSWWQGRYRELAGEREKAVARLEEMKGQENTAKRKKLILQRASDRAAVKEAEAQLGAQEEILKGIDANISELEGRALKAGVPPRWKEPASR